MIKDVIEKEIDAINHNRNLSPLAILTALNNAYTKIIPGIEKQELLFDKALEALIEITILLSENNPTPKGQEFMRKFINIIEQATGKKWEDV